MLKHLHLLLTLPLMFIGATSVSAAEELFKTLTFSSETFGRSVQSYTATWDNTVDGVTWTLQNFNNNNKGWNYVKCGRSKHASTARITNKVAYEFPVSKMVITLDKVNNVKTAKVLVSETADFSSVSKEIDITGSFTEGQVTCAIESPSANSFYRLQIEVKPAKSNGVVQISKIEYYRAVDATTIDITEGKYGTVCLPKGGTVSGAKFFSIEGKQMTDGSVKSISLTEVEKAQAGVPYIFLGQGDKLTVTHEGEAAQTASSANGLVGSFSGMSVAEGMYVVYNNQVVKAGTGVTITANHAYINMADVPETPASSGARMFYFDTTTGINLMESARQADQVFDLQGRKTNLNRQGLFIVNGKKVVLK